MREENYKSQMHLNSIATVNEIRAPSTQRAEQLVPLTLCHATKHRAPVAVLHAVDRHAAPQSLHVAAQRIRGQDAMLLPKINIVVVQARVRDPEVLSEALHLSHSKLDPLVQLRIHFPHHIPRSPLPLGSLGWACRRHAVFSKSEAILDPARRPRCVPEHIRWQRRRPAAFHHGNVIVHWNEWNWWRCSWQHGW